MARIALSSNELKEYVVYLNGVLSGRHINAPIMYTKNVFFFHLSGLDLKRLTISLEPNSPRIYPSNSEIDGSSMESPFVSSLRKELGNAYITGVKQVNEDRIITIDYLTLNEIFKEVRRTLLIELMPRGANLMVLDEDSKILTIYKPSPIGNKRTLLRGFKYSLPEKKGNAPDINGFSIDRYLEECGALEEEIKNKRKEERFSYLFKYLRTKEKSLIRKIKSLEEEIEEAKLRINDNLKGDAIFICYNDIPPKAKSFIYEGEEIILNPAKSLSNNAESYYSRAKKAKRTIEEGKKHIELANKELEDIQIALASLEASDEEGLEKLASELNLTPQKSNGFDKSGVTKNLSKEAIPYYIDYHGTKILFGKNAKQNAFLSFLYATNKEHLWFHVKGDSGSHVIIRKDDPTDDEIIGAASLAVYASHLQDGEVLYTKHKNIRKGKNLGQAVVSKYESVYIRNIPSEIKNLADSARRVSLK